MDSSLDAIGDPDAFINSIRDSFPPSVWQDVTVLTAVSGGADSTAMLRAFHGLRQPGGLGRLCVAHFNHRWRQSASDEDANFVQSLSHSLNLECFIGNDVKSQTNSNPSEQSARDLRYDFLIETAKNIGARHILTAHTRDDQIETILHRIVRGTGLRGLQGIPKVRVIDESLTVVRPMLEATRAEVLDYLARMGQAFQTDATNANDKYMRNRIRNQLLPLLRNSFHENIDDSLLRLGRIATDAHADTQLQISRLIPTSVTLGKNHVLIRRNDLKPCSRHLLRELASELWHRMQWPLQDMGYKRLEELASYFADDSLELTTMLPGRVRVEVTPDNVRLTREDT